MCAILLVAVVIKRKGKQLITGGENLFHDDFPFGLCGEVVGEQLWLHDCLTLCAPDLVRASHHHYSRGNTDLHGPLSPLLGPFLPLRTWGVQGQPVVGREMM